MCATTITTTMMRTPGDSLLSLSLPLLTPHLVTILIVGKLRRHHLPRVREKWMIDALLRCVPFRRVQGEHGIHQIDRISRKLRKHLTNCASIFLHFDRVEERKVDDGRPHSGTRGATYATDEVQLLDFVGTEEDGFLAEQFSQDTTTTPHVN